MQVIIVNGYPLAGKDTFVDFCIEHLTKRELDAVKYSSVDMVKEAALLLGWSGTKNDIDRDFLSELKMLSSKYYEGPTTYLTHKVVSHYENGITEAIFVFVREPDEIEKLCKSIRQYCPYIIISTVLVTSDRSKKNLTNIGDSSISHYDYDYFIDNNFTLDKLRSLSIDFCANRFVLND